MSSIVRKAVSAAAHMANDQNTTQQLCELLRFGGEGTENGSLQPPDPHPGRYRYRGEGEGEDQWSTAQDCFQPLQLTSRV